MWAEKRKDPRLHCIGWAEVRLISGHPLFEGRVHNLSCSGCRVWSREILDLLPGCEVEIVLEVDGIRFRVLGVLRSEHRENGFGIEFLELSPRCRCYIDDLILELAFYQRPTAPIETPAMLPDEGAVEESTIAPADPAG